MSELSAPLAALALGLRHALEPAHLAAVGALVSLGGGRARGLALVGVYSAAHALAVALLGLGALLLGDSLGGGAVALLERVGGLVLIALGLLALRALFTGRDGHPVGELATRLGSAGLAGAALFGALHALGGEGALQAFATAGLASATSGPLLLALFAAALVGANLLAALLIAGGIRTLPSRRLRLLLLTLFAALSLFVGVETLVG